MNLILNPYIHESVKKNYFICAYIMILFRLLWFCISIKPLRITFILMNDIIN